MELQTNCFNLWCSHCMCSCFRCGN